MGNHGILWVSVGFVSATTPLTSSLFSSLLSLFVPSVFLVVLLLYDSGTALYCSGTFPYPTTLSHSLCVYFIVYTPLDVGLFLSLLYAILTVLLVMQVLSYLCLIYSYAIYSIITMTNTITCVSVIGYITYDIQGSSSQRSCLHRFHYGRRCCLRILFS